jgi:hypothetical protein
MSCPFVIPTRLGDVFSKPIALRLARTRWMRPPLKGVSP